MRRHMGLTPQVTDEGNRILIFSHTKPTADDFDPTIMMKRMGMLMDLVLLEGIVQNGIEIVVDFRHVCFGQLTRYNLALTKRVYDIAMVSRNYTPISIIGWQIYAILSLNILQ